MMRGMYLRLTQRRNRDGSVVRYVQLAHNRRVNGRARAEVVANLGREDQIDVAALRGLVASIGRYLDRVEPADPPAAEAIEPPAEAVEPPAPSSEPDADHPAGPGKPGADHPAGPGEPGADHPAGPGKPVPADHRSGWAGPPMGVDRLVGRDRALADLPGLLSRHPLLTITGPAGVGKTRLAVEFAHRVQARYRKGMWWADLTPLPPGSPVDATLAAAVGVSGEPGRDLRKVIAEGCGTGPALLVLDNCEHVVDCCAELVTWLLGACPKLRIVATSREGLRIPGETLYPLPPLAVPAGDAIVDVRATDSVRLFLDRATAASPGFELTDELTALVGQLCTHLDGLPLAIELTARQLTTLTLPQLVKRLDDRLALLTGGSRAAPDRHRSLRAAISWSYELLDPRERAVFRRLCALPGGFDETGAAAICADLGLADTDLWAILRTLVDKSMFAPDSSTAPAVRFRILESLRTFGLDQLRHEDEADDIRERLLAWLTDLVGPVITEPVTPPAALQRLDDERHNLNHGLHLLDNSGDPRYVAFAVGAAWIVRKQGHVQESRQLLIRALARHPEPTPARAAALGSLAMTENWAGDYPAAQRYAEQSLDLAGQLGHRALQDRASQRLALALCNLGDYAAAVALTDRTVASIRASGDVKTLPIVLNDLAWQLVHHGDLPAAARAADEALAALAMDEKIIWDDVMHTAGTIAFRQGRLDQAGVYFSLALATDVSYTAQVPYNLEGLALTAAAAGHPQRALRLIAAASTARTTAGRRTDPWWAGLCTETIGPARDGLTAAQAASATAEGERLAIEDAVRYALLDQWPPAGRAKASPLTPREHQVAQLVADGHTNPQIAARLGVSPRTVVNHLEHIKTKLDVHTRTEIAAWTTRRAPDGSP
jgi:predicted ATPase/DNA-binding CsgD family transcriptional regulator